MNEFSHKAILGSQTLGDKLKRAREEEGLSLKQVAQQTRIKEEFLHYLETGQYSKLVSPVYIKNYLKKYSEFLQLNWVIVEKMYQKEMIVFKKQEPKKLVTKFSQPALVIPKLIYGVLIGLLLIVLGMYLVYEISNFIQPPDLTVNLPDQLTIREHSINIEGKVEQDTQIFINGQEIITNKEGVFKEEVSLQTGLNTIKISAKTMHSKERIIYKQIFVEE